MKTKRQYLILIVLLTGLLINFTSCGNSDKKKNDIDEIAGQTEFLSAEFGAQRNEYTATADDSVTVSVENLEVAEVAREIEEADIVKVYGSRLYILNRYKGMIICDISQPDQPYISGHAQLSGEPVEMYVKNNTAYILTKASPYMYPHYEVTDVVELMAYSPETEKQVSNLYEVDISDNSNPEIIKTIEIDGAITESRIVGSILYVVSTFGSYTSGEGYTADSYVASLNIETPGNLTEIDKETFQNGTNYIHVTDSAIFAITNGGSYQQQTADITYIDISDTGGQISIRGNVSVRGSVADKFKLNSYNGYLRICSYDWNTRESLLHVISLDNPDQMEITGELLVVQGERLYATRFDGDTAYIVTFEVIDPLWVVDLSDPASPTILGELEVPGWSTHIEVRNNRLIALGVDNSSSSNKVAVSYFDVENPESPSLIKRISFGEENGWSYSNGYYDEKSFKIIDSMGLILLPYSTSYMSGNKYIYESRLQLISFTEDDIRAGGSVTQNGEVLRSGNYENRLFSVSNDELRVIDASNIDTPSVTAILPLIQNVRKLVTLENGYGVIAIDKHDGSTVLQSVELSNPETPVSGEMMVGTSVSDIFTGGNRVYVVSNNTYPNSSQESFGTSIVEVYDFSSATEPVKKGNLEIQGNYYTQFDNRLASSIHSKQNRVFHLGEERYLFAHAGTKYYYYTEEINGETVYWRGNISDGKITVVDFTDPDSPKKSSELTIDKAAIGGFVANKTYYYSYKTDYHHRDNVKNLKKYFMGRIDATDPENLIELKDVNIPGIALHSDTSGTLFYTVNARLDDDDKIDFTYNSVELKNDLAVGINSVSITSFPGSCIVTDDRAYFEPSLYRHYDDNNGEIVVVERSGHGKLNANISKIYPEDSYQNILWADGNNLITGNWGMLSLHNATSPSDIKPGQEILIKGYVRSITKSGSVAYTSLGYDGVRKIDLLSK